MTCRLDYVIYVGGKRYPNSFTITDVMNDLLIERLMVEITKDIKLLRARLVEDGENEGADLRRA